MWEVKVKFVDRDEREDYIKYLYDYRGGKLSDITRIQPSNKREYLKFQINTIEAFQEVMKELVSTYILWGIDTKILESPIDREDFYSAIKEEEEINAVT